MTLFREVLVDVLSGRSRSRRGKRNVLLSRASWHSIWRPDKGHKADEHNRARLRLTRSDRFYDGELLCGVGGPQWHHEPATHFQLFDQRWRDILVSSGHDDYVERTAFRPTVVAV